jgi:hypothetical protein
MSLAGLDESAVDTTAAIVADCNLVPDRPRNRRR